MTIIKKLLLFCFLLQIALFVSAQNPEQFAAKSNKLVTDYNRNAITFIFLENNSVHNQAIKEASPMVKFSSKFDAIRIPKHSIGSARDPEAIKKKLMEQKIPNQILANWFSRDTASGTMDMTVIHKRGMYNATADDLAQASSSKVGLASLKDAGESLINHSYIFVVAVDDIIDMDKVYDKEDAARKIAAELFKTDFSPVERNKNGWQGKLNGYLFKLAFNDEMMQSLYNDMWIYEDDDQLTKNLKKAKFEAEQFPVSFIMEVNGVGKGAQYNPGHPLAPNPQKTESELFVDVLNAGMEQCIFDVERNVTDFQVKTPVYNNNPITAKIGDKEGLKIDQRYAVVEFKTNRKGETKTVRKGIVRANDVMLNKDETFKDKRKFSTFYQTSGVSIEPGMLMRQMPELGIGISGGFTLIGSMRGGYGKVELNTSKAFTNGPTQVKIFGAFAVDQASYNINGAGDESIEFMRWQVGMSKGYYFANNFSIAPFAAYGMETANYAYENAENISTRLINLGVYGTINILHNLQAVGTVNLYAPFGYIVDQDGNDIDGKKYNNDFFKDRKAITIDVGLRLEL